MEEIDFWEFVTAGESGLDVEERCDVIKAALVEKDPEFIAGFSDELARLLYNLDLRELGEIPVVDERGESPQSDDRFLYARCAVVLAGPVAYAEVLANPSTFVKYTSDDAARAEILLDAAKVAYEQMTGLEWNHIEPHDYETGANEAGWDR